jgi:AraC family transcriptional regulator
MLPSPFVRLRINDYAPEDAISHHAHEKPSFSLVLRGHIEERIRGRHLEHGSGDFLFCPAHEPHAQQFGRMGAQEILIIPQPETLNHLSERGIDLSQAPFMPRHPVMQSLGRRLQHELHASDPFTGLTTDALMLEMLALFGRNFKKERTEHISPWIRTAREYLDDAPQHTWSLAELAALVGKHSVHLARSFRTAFGCTVGDYLRLRRAEQAATLLQKTRKPMTEIASQCGYGDAAEFSRSFKKAFGLTPSAFRHQAR